jgi:NarL family two-component system response regulator LiaR
VLLIDDHAVVREGLRALLEAGDEEIVVAGEAATTDSGYDAALELEPDVVLVDLSLPGRPVPQLIRELRAALPATRIVVLTAMIDERWVQETLQAGACGYLLKDITRRELVAAIEGARAGRPVLHPEAQRLLLRGLSRPPETDPLAGLSPRERSVLRQLALGRNNRDIAKHLYLSIGTVKGYVSSLLSKLQVADRTQAAVLAVRAGILEQGSEGSSTTT